MYDMKALYQAKSVADAVALQRRRSVGRSSALEAESAPQHRRGNRRLHAAVELSVI